MVSLVDRREMGIYCSGIELGSIIKASIENNVHNEPVRVVIQLDNGYLISLDIDEWEKLLVLYYGGQKIDTVKEA